MDALAAHTTDAPRHTQMVFSIFQAGSTDRAKARPGGPNFGICAHKIDDGSSRQLLTRNDTLDPDLVGWFRAAVVAMSEQNISNTDAACGQRTNMKSLNGLTVNNLANLISVSSVMMHELTRKLTIESRELGSLAESLWKSILAIICHIARVHRNVKHNQDNTTGKVADALGSLALHERRSSTPLADSEAHATTKKHEELAGLRTGMLRIGQHISHQQFAVRLVQEVAVREHEFAPECIHRQEFAAQEAMCGISPTADGVEHNAQLAHEYACAHLRNITRADDATAMLKLLDGDLCDLVDRSSSPVQHNTRQKKKK